MIDKNEPILLETTMHELTVVAYYLHLIKECTNIDVDKEHIEILNKIIKIGQKQQYEIVVGRLNYVK